MHIQQKKSEEKESTLENITDDVIKPKDREEVCTVTYWGCQLTYEVVMFTLGNFISIITQYIYQLEKQHNYFACQIVSDS